MASLAGAGVVVGRETSRSARRPALPAQRVVFAAALLAVVLVAAWRLATYHLELSSFGEVGRDTFQIYRLVQVGLVVLLAPVLVGGGLVEEIEARTLDLLVLTRLDTGALVWGKVGSRLVVMVTLILGATPAVALLTSLGGVSTWEVVGLTLHSLVIALLLGAVGGVAAMVTRSTLAGAGVAWLWGLGALVVLPAVFGALSHLSGHPLGRIYGQTAAWWSPIFALGQTGWQLFLPAAAALPLLGFTSALAIPLFEIESTGGEWALSPSIWQWERIKTRMRLAGLAVVALVVALPAFSLWIPDWLGVPLMWLTGVTAMCLSVGVGVGATWWAAHKQRELSHRLPGAGLLGRRQRLVDPGSAPRRLLGEVWPNPIAWRELATRWSGAQRVGVGMACGLLGVLTLLALHEGLTSYHGFHGDYPKMIMVAGAGLTPVLTWLLVISTLVAEQQQRTLEGLALTTLGSRQLLVGKLAAVGARVLPILALVLVFMVLHDNDRFTVGVAMLLGLSALWLGLSWLVYALLCLVVGLRVRAGSVSWGLSAVLVLAWLAGPPILVWLLDLPEDLFISFQPFYDPEAFFELERHGLRELLVSTGIHLGLSAVLLLGISLRWRRWVSP